MSEGLPILDSVGMSLSIPYHCAEHFHPRNSFFQLGDIY